MRVCTLLAFVLPALAQAQTPSAAPAASPPPVVHRVEKVSPHAYAIFGQGGNIGLLVTDHHAILIDDQFERLVPGLLEAVRSVTRAPIRYLINTHFHGDHTGGNVVLEKQVQVIAAHTNARTRLGLDQAKLDPTKRGGLPEIALGDPDPKVKARLTLHLERQVVVLEHVAPGHTDGDVMVWMPEEKVLHMGDLFFNGLLPFIDTKNGGNLAGYLQNVEAALLLATPDAKVIPGHGPVTDIKSLGRFRDFLRQVASHADKHRGATAKEAAASFDQAAWPEYKPSARFVSWESLMGAALGTGPGR